MLSCFWAWSVVDAVRKEAAKAARSAAGFRGGVKEGNKVNEGDPGGGGRSRGLTTIVGGRRLVGWRSSSGAGVVLLQGSEIGGGGLEVGLAREGEGGEAVEEGGGGERGGRCAIM